MVRYPVGIQTFEKIREGGYLYVDKTALIYQMVQSSDYVFLSRPRRFGKSLLTNTLDSYFRGRKDLFEGLALAGLEKEWKEYPVLHFDLSGIKRGTVEDFDTKMGASLRFMEEEYGVEKQSDDVSTRFSDLVVRIAQKTGKKVVLLSDEYDSPLLTVLNAPDRPAAMRTELQAFYAPIKKLDPYLRFVFITGITRFPQLSIFSQLNNLSNITMNPQYATILGFTEEELEDNFHEGIQKIADNNDMTYDEAFKEMEKLYDGYHFTRHSKGVYNPFNVLLAVNACNLDYYWFETGTPTYLIKTLKAHNAPIPQLEDSKAYASEFDAPTETMVNPFPLLYQSSYLTIKDYDRENKKYTLGSWLQRKKYLHFQPLGNEVVIKLPLGLV